ncbi:TPA: penicillin-binding protein 3, partial [Bacillus cereus]|nr:penicillin-binding protein 3 [Bacillus cereus]
MRKIWGILFLCLTFMLVGCGKEEKPQEVFDTYVKAWNKQKFADMYDQLSKNAKKDISKKEFTEKYEKIYSGIEVKDLKVETGEVKEDKKDEGPVPFKVSMDTVGGKITFGHEAKMVKEKDGDKESWKIDWTPDFIFPGMTKDSKVRMQTTQPKRGEIYDRNGKGLATNGKASEIGLIPEKLGDTAPQTKETVAKLLNMSVEEIDQKLAAKWVKPGYLVPIGILPEGATQNTYIDLPG